MKIGLARGAFGCRDFSLLCQFRYRQIGKRGGRCCLSCGDVSLPGSKAGAAVGGGAQHRAGICKRCISRVGGGAGGFEILRRLSLPWGGFGNFITACGGFFI